MRYGARAYSLDDVVFLAEAGFDFAEIDWKDPHLTSTQLPELAALRDKHDIAYRAHGPNEGNPFDVDKIVDEARCHQAQSGRTYLDLNSERSGGNPTNQTMPPSDDGTRVDSGGSSFAAK